MGDSTANHDGVDFKANQVTVGGDVTGRDKTVQGDEVRGDKIVNYMQLDVQKLVETLKQALPAGDPLPQNLIDTLKDFREFHTRLYEWKELHNVLNDVVFVFDQFAREVERRDAAGEIGDVRLLKRLWRPIEQKVEILRDFAARVTHIGSPLVVLSDGSLQGPPWAIDLVAGAERMQELFAEDSVDMAALYDATYAFSDAAEKHVYLADKQLREAAGELYNLSNVLLGSLSHDDV